MEERDDYPIIPQPEKEKWDDYKQIQKELASLKEVVKELIPIAVDAVDWQYFHGIQTKVEEYQKVIDRAKTLLR